MLRKVLKIRCVRQSSLNRTLTQSYFFFKFREKKLKKNKHAALKLLFDALSFEVLQRRGCLNIKLPPCAVLYIIVQSYDARLMHFFL